MADMREELAAIRRDAEDCARFYEDKPGLSRGAGSIIDLYRAIARLSQAVERAMKADTP